MNRIQLFSARSLSSQSSVELVSVSLSKPFSILFPWLILSLVSDPIVDAGSFQSSFPDELDFGSNSLVSFRSDVLDAGSSLSASLVSGSSSFVALESISARLPSLSVRSLSSFSSIPNSCLAVPQLKLFVDKDNTRAGVNLCNDLDRCLGTLPFAVRDNARAGVNRCTVNMGRGSDSLS